MGRRAPVVEQSSRSSLMLDRRVAIGHSSPNERTLQKPLNPQITKSLKIAPLDPCRSAGYRDRLARLFCTNSGRVPAISRKTRETEASHTPTKRSLTLTIEACQREEGIWLRITLDLTRQALAERRPHLVPMA